MRAFSPLPVLDPSALVMKPVENYLAPVVCSLPDFRFLSLVLVQHAFETDFILVTNGE